MPPKEIPRSFFNIYDMQEDHNGTFWAGADGSGLLVFDRKAGKFIRQYKHKKGDPNSLSHDKIKALFMDSENGLWIGTMGGGLNLYNREKDNFIHYKFNPQDRNRLNDDHVTAIHEQPAGILWIGTMGGLNRLDKATNNFRHFTIREGLPSNYIYAITNDDSGHLWVSSDNGLSRIDLKTYKIKNYNKSDGLPANTCNEHVSFKSKSGELYFASNNVAFSFHPDSLKDDLCIPPVVITNFKIKNEPVSLDSVITEKSSLLLTHDQNVVSFEFAALDYTAPHKNQYSYKMQGFDESWQQNGNKRFANYTNLDPGNYIFRVKASNHDGIWNEEGTSINIIILPPWWRTIWAYVFYFIITVFLLFTWRKFDKRQNRIKLKLEMQRFEVEKLRETDQIKTRFFANISHEFRTPLMLIKGPVKKILKETKNETTRKVLSSVNRNANVLAELIDQLLDLAKLDAGAMGFKAHEEDSGPLLKGLTYSFLSAAQLKSIELDVKTLNKHNFHTQQYTFFDWDIFLYLDDRQYLIKHR